MPQVSRFEQTVLDEMERRGVPLTRQARLSGFWFDAQVTGAKILLECDGTYWHNKPRAHNTDSRKNAWCRKNGYTLVRFSEADWRENPRLEISQALRMIGVALAQAQVPVWGVVREDGPYLSLIP